jgi:hypothetical protein
MIALYIFLAVVILYLIGLRFLPKINFTKDLPTLIISSIIIFGIGIYLFYDGMSNHREFPIILAIASVMVILLNILKYRKTKTK